MVPVGQPSSARGVSAEDAAPVPSVEVTDGNATIRPKKKGKASALLRDYYGLSKGLSQANEDPTDPDSAAFDRKAAYKAIVASSTLPDLLKRESSLLSEIRELDGERQSLVYNHHHELIAASETIRKMKARAESLDGSLDELRTSFSNISQLSSELSVPSLLSSSQSAVGNVASASTALDVRIPSDASTKLLRLDAELQAELMAIVSLPTRLRETLSGRPAASRRQSSSSQATAKADSSGDAAETTLTPQPLTAKEALAEAEKLWGQREPIIAKWSDAGIDDVRRVAQECRTILRDTASALAAS